MFSRRVVKVVAWLLLSKAVRAQPAEEVSAAVHSRYEALPYPCEDDEKALWYQIKRGPLYLRETLETVYASRVNLCDTVQPLRILAVGSVSSSTHRFAT